MDRIRSFFHGVRKEAEKVRWPSKKNMIKDSSAVLMLCVFLGIFFYVINVLFILLMGVKR